MTSHKYTYPKVTATRKGPSAYERRTEVLKALEREKRDADKDEPRKRRPAD